MGCELQKLAKAIIKEHPTGDTAQDLQDILSNATLYSTANNTNTKFMTEEENLKVNALHSVEGIKAIVNELNDQNIDNKYKDYVLRLLDNINPEFLPDLMLYINTDAAKNDGMISNTEIVINTSPELLVNTSEMSATEVYAHELMHAITKFAVSNSKKDPVARKLVRQIEHLRTLAENNTTYRDLMPDQSLDFKKEKKLAQKRWDYIFNGKNSVHEFIAHGLTNPKLMRKLSKINTKEESLSILAWLGKFAKDLINVVLGNTSFKADKGSIRKELHELVFQLMESNNKAVNEAQKQKTLTQAIGKTIDKYGNANLVKLIDKLGELATGNPNKFPKQPVNGSRLQNTVWAMKILPRLMFDKKYRHIRDAALSALGMNPEGFFQNVIRDFQDPDKLERQIEHLGLMSDKIDAARQLIIKSTREAIYDEFERKLTKVEEEAIILSGIDLDIGSIYKAYGRTKTARMLTSPEMLNKQIKTVKSQLKKVDETNFNWNINQATGLGYYLATHKAGIVQNLNATNIAKGLLSGKRRTPHKDVVRLVDELSTLVGISYTSQDSNNIVGNLIMEEKKGMDYIVRLNEGAKLQSRKDLFETKAQIIKGYSKEVFDSSITVEIRPLDQEDVMISRGFELMETLTPATSDKTGIPMGVYRAKHYVNNAYNRTATRMTDQIKKGTSILDTMRSVEGITNVDAKAKKEMRRIRDEAIVEAEKMAEGTYKPDPNNQITPVLDRFGNVTTYRYTMSKQHKKELLNQDTTVGEVMGRTLGSIEDKIGTREQNEAVLDVILADMKKNFDPLSNYGKKNSKEYIKIEPESDNKTVQEIYRILPHNMKQAIRDSDLGYIAVRRDMLFNYFGFRDATLTDFMGLHRITPDIIQSWIRVAEAMWRDIVSISKVDIIIRTPMVFIGNVISNFMYSVVMGVNPVRVAKMQLDNMRNVTHYMKNAQELSRLQVDTLVGKNTKSKIARLEAEQLRNPVHDLMVAGMYQAIVEDIDKRDLKSSNRLAQRASEINLVKNMPEFVKTGVNWAYLNENTGFFKFMTKATQYSDFIARATEYQLQMERGVSKKKALTNVLDIFINYGKPASSFEEYLNDMGLIMFTKYAKRIQRVIATSGREKPANILLSVIGQELFMGIDDIWDQHPLVRSYTNIGISPFEHVYRAMTPTAFQYAGVAN